MVFAGCFRACDWRGAGLDLAGGWRSTAWSWLVMFGLLFLLFISSFLQILEESLPFFGKKNLVGIVVGYYGVFLIKGSWGSLVY